MSSAVVNKEVSYFKQRAAILKMLSANWCQCYLWKHNQPTKV